MLEFLYSSSLIFKNETPAEVFSCEFCKIFDKTFFIQMLRATSSMASKFILQTNIFSEAATRGVQQKKCSWKLCKFQRKTSVLKCLFNKVAGLGLQLYLKETSTQVLSCEICEIFKNTYVEERLTAASPF